MASDQSQRVDYLIDGAVLSVTFSKKETPHLDGSFYSKKLHGETVQTTHDNAYLVGLGMGTLVGILISMTYRNLAWPR